MCEIPTEKFPEKRNVLTEKNLHCRVNYAIFLAVQTIRNTGASRGDAPPIRRYEYVWKCSS